LTAAGTDQAVTHPDLATEQGPVAVEVDVSDLLPWSQYALVRGWVKSPRGLDPDVSPVALCCLPGGQCSTGYFDLAVDALAGYSMADYLVERGFVVVSFDHLGIGTSDSVEDIFAVTPSLVAAVSDRAYGQVVDRLRAGTAWPGIGPMPGLVAVGVGHSMGGMLASVQQGVHRSFDALAVLGHGGDGLPQFVTEAELAWAREPRGSTEELVALARVRAETPASGRPRLAPGTFLPRDVPDVVRAAFVAQQVPLLLSCGLLSMLPGGTDREKAAVDVPVFLGFGDHDFTSDFVGAVARYPASRDVTLFVNPNTPHCHNQAASRTALWERLGHWARGL
jgi:hypothetical protein